MKRKVTWKRTAAIAACAVLFGATAGGGFAAALPAGAVSGNRYAVDLQKQMQEFDGWGLSLSWWATEIGDWTRLGSTGLEKREEIAEALYGKSGLNLNIARYNVGGGDDPEHIHMTDDRNTPGWRGATKETYTDAAGNEYPLYAVDENYCFVGENGEILDWTQVPDHRQLWVLNWIQNNPDRAEDYLSEYYSNSPPYWMTIQGCSSGGAGGGQNLDSANNQMFVEYFLDVYEYLTAQGFRLDNLQPFNESGSYYWGTNGDQEGCYFSPAQKLEVLDLLRKEMEKRGLDVPYNWGDETNTDVAYQQYTQAKEYSTDTFVGKDIVEGADRYTYHIYWYDRNGLERFYRNAKADGKELYMSEICWSEGADNGEAEYDPDSLKTGFKYTQSIIDTVKYGGVDAYVFWQGMEDMVGQMKSGTNYGLIQGVYYTQEEAEEQGVDLASMGLTYQDYVLSKAYYMSGQYTKYINKGYTIVDVGDENSLAAISPDGRTLVIVKQNNSENGESLSYDLSGFNASSVEKVYTDKTHSWAKGYVSTDGKSVSDSVSANSVTTYIVHGEKTVGDGCFTDESAFKRAEGLEAIQTALEAGGESEQFYSDFTTGGGNAGFFGQTTYTKSGYSAFRFYGTGFGLVFTQKSDSGKVNIWIDADPATEPATAEKDFYSSTAKTGEIGYRNNDLDEGWHTVYLQGAEGAHGSWVNFDGVFLYTSSDGEETGPLLSVTGAAGVGGEVRYEYEAAESLGDVYAEVFENGAWTKHVGEGETAQDGKGVLFTGERSVRIRLAAENGGETVYSPERVVNVLPVTEGVLYFVDCATADPNSLVTGASLGELQSASDQPLGEDVFSGKRWGYKGNYTGYYSSDEAMSSIWSLDNTSDTEIAYEFTIPTPGTYRVALGFFGGGTGWGSRSVTAKVNGQSKNRVLNAGEYASLYFKVTTTADDEVVSVSVGKQNSNQNSSHLSLIAITEDGVQLPLYTSGGSNYNKQGVLASKEIIIGEDIYAAAEGEKFTLYLSDGNTEELTSGDAEISVSTANIIAGIEAIATYRFTGDYEGLESYASFLWAQSNGVSLYYNIDCAYVGNGTPPDDTTELGSKQSTTHDREFGEDNARGTQWGYVGDHYGDGYYWENDQMNKWSIREGKDEGQSLTYKMTGFKPNELLTIETGGHCSTWGNRTYTVFVNGTDVGYVDMKSGDGVMSFQTFEGENVKADENGELTVKCQKRTGDGPQVAYIKVWSVGVAYPKEATITADKTTVERTDTVELRNLNPEAIVYVLNEDDVVLGNFKPEGASQEIAVADYLPETSYQLRFTQAVPDKTDPSKELVVDVLGLEILQEESFVRDGDAAVVRFVPHTLRGVTSLVMTTPDGVKLDVTEGFFYRAKTNGVYSVTLVSGSASITETFEVDTVDTVEFGETYNTRDWTSGSVSVTFEPKAKSGVVSVSIDGAPVAAQGGKYTLTATENGEHTVKIVTGAGFEYERVIKIENIDKTAPQVSFDLDLTQGLKLNFSAVSASEGKLYVSFNGTEQEVTERNAYYLIEEGKYEFYYKNGAGATTEKTVYYVSYGAEAANLAKVTLGGDGSVSVSEKTKTAPAAKLYRAGSNAPIETMKAEKAGRYYLELEQNGEKEIVVLEISAQNAAGCGALIGGRAALIGCALLAAAAACMVLTKKGRKNDEK